MHQRATRCIEIIRNEWMFIRHQIKDGTIAERYVVSLNAILARIMSAQKAVMLQTGHVICCEQKQKSLDGIKRFLSDSAGKATKKNKWTITERSCLMP